MNKIIDYLVMMNFYNYINYFDYTNLLLTSKKFYKDYIFANNDNIYRYYLIIKFSNNFVDHAKKFIISYYDCFYRIVNFEKMITNENLELWDEKTYLAFWKIKYI